MATIVAEQSTVMGRKVTMAAAAGGGDQMVNDARSLVQITNGSAAPITVTFASTAAEGSGLEDDVDKVIPAGETHVFGPFPQNRFGATLQWTYSAADTVTVGALKY